MPHIIVNETGIEFEEYGSKLGQPFLLICGFTRSFVSWPTTLIDGLVEAGHRVSVFSRVSVGGGPSDSLSFRP